MPTNLAISLYLSSVKSCTSFVSGSNIAPKDAPIAVPIAVPKYSPAADPTGPNAVPIAPPITAPIAPNIAEPQLLPQDSPTLASWPTLLASSIAAPTDFTKSSLVLSISTVTPKALSFIL